MVCDSLHIGPQLVHHHQDDRHPFAVSLN
jgi:hypothetical protein